MVRLLRGLARALGLLVLVLILSFGFLVWQVDHLGRQDGARPADVIVVLGARVNPDGSPGSDLTSRTLRAVDLWQQGYSSYIICSGGFKDDLWSAAAVCKRYAIELGVPAERLWLADGTNSTVEDAQSAAAVMRAQGWRTALLVSHPLHLYRARWLFRQAGVDVLTSPTSTDTRQIFPPLRLWYAVREAGAIIITILDDRGWVPGEWMAQLQSWQLSLP